MQTYPGFLSEMFREGIGLFWPRFRFPPVDPFCLALSKPRGTAGEQGRGEERRGVPPLAEAIRRGDDGETPSKLVVCFPDGGWFDESVYVSSLCKRTHQYAGPSVQPRLPAFMMA